MYSLIVSLIKAMLLSSNSISLSLYKLMVLKSGYYWLDNSIIKAIDNNGELHKIVRIKISDNLNIELSWYKEDKFQIIGWVETINLSSFVFCFK